MSSYLIVSHVHCPVGHCQHRLASFMPSIFLSHHYWYVSFMVWYFFPDHYPFSLVLWPLVTFVTLMLIINYVWTFLDSFLLTNLKMLNFIVDTDNDNAATDLRLWHNFMSRYTVLWYSICINTMYFGSPHQSTSMHFNMYIRKKILSQKNLTDHEYSCINVIDHK